MDAMPCLPAGEAVSLACNTQAGLFVRSAEKGYDSETFIDAFMESMCAADMDRPEDMNNWMGVDYAMDMFEDEALEKLVNGIGIPGREVWDPSVLEWIGYIYRHWSIAMGMSSREIHAIADAGAMRRAWDLYHLESRVDDVIALIMEQSTKNPSDHETIRA